jgi:hypothetical protein
MRSIRFAALLIVGSALPGSAAAQAGTRALTVGAVVPRGPLAVIRRTGLALGGSRWLGAPHRVWRVRALGEYWYVPARAPGTSALHAVQGFGTVVVALPRGPLQPAVLVGLGPAVQHVRGDAQVASLAPAAVAGVGLAWRRAETELLRVELRAHVIASQYGLADYEWPAALVLAGSLEF